MARDPRRRCCATSSENSQDNGYLLNQIARRYEDGNPEGVASVFNVPDQIAALTGAAIQQAAQTYLEHWTITCE